MAKRVEAKSSHEKRMIKSILTDNQFWIPLIVLLLGIGLLVYLA
jgi:hypothetical protein